MSDLEQLTSSGDEELDDFATRGGDGWPVWCERVALLLTIALFGSLTGAVLLGIGFGATGVTGGVSTAARLRFAAQYVNPIDPILALGAVLLVAMDGITSGLRLGPSTDTGRVAVYGAGVMSGIAGLVSAARAVDVMVGHVGLFGEAPSAPVAYRSGIVLTFLVTLLISAAACWGALQALDDTDRLDGDELEGEDDWAYDHDPPS